MRIKPSLTAALLVLALPLFGQTPRSDDLFVPRAAASHILVPAAGNVEGANGTFFRTDINVINLSNVDQRIAFYWFPINGTGGVRSPKVLKINGRSGLFSSDFVGSVLEETGLGSIEIIALDTGGEEDPLAQIHATVRIWTPEPNVPNGTMSQSFPAIVMTSASFSSVKTIFGVQRDSQYRLNVGIANPSNTPQRFRVTAIPSSDTNVRETVNIEVPRRAMQQVLIPGTSTGTFQIMIVNLDDASNETQYQAWASSIDNITGDAWSQVAFPTP